MITTVEGVSGAGKSLILAMLADAEVKKERRVFAEADFAFQGYEEFTLPGPGSDGYSDCSIYLDDAYRFFDSRASASVQNREMTLLVGMSGHNRVDIYIGVLALDILDRRIRRLVGTRIICKGVKEEKAEVSIVSASSGEEKEVTVDLSGLYSLVKPCERLRTIQSWDTLGFIKEVLEV